MGAVEEHAPVTTVARTGRQWQIPWATVLVTVVLPIPFLAVGGFFFGTVQGDIPWPATPQEEFIYYSARNFSWIGWALALPGIIASALSGRRLSVGSRVANAAIAAAAAAFIGFIAFFSAYAYGTSSYLFAFT